MKRTTIQRIIIAIIAVACLIALAVVWKKMKRGINSMLNNDQRSAVVLAVSPDGRKVAYGLHDGCHNGAEGIYLIDSDEDNLTPLIEHLGIGQLPKVISWSLSGRQLAFSGQGRIIIFDLKSGKKYDVMDGWCPAWSPEGMLALAAPGPDQPILTGSGAQMLPGRTITLYDPATGQSSALATLAGFTDQPGRLTWPSASTVRVLTDSPDTLQPGWIVWDIGRDDRAAVNKLFIGRENPKVRCIGLSPNGSQVLLDKDSLAWLVDVAGARSQQLMDDKTIDMSWRGDGKAIFYSINREIWMLTLSSGARTNCGVFLNKLIVPPSACRGTMAYSAYIPTGDGRIDQIYERGVLYIQDVKF